MLNRIQDASLTFAPDSSLLCPTGSNINAIEAKNEAASGRIAAMSDGVGLNETGDGFIPLIGFDWDLFFDDRAWFGGSEACFTVFSTTWLQEPVLWWQERLSRAYR